MIILEKEKVTINPDIKVIKRYGCMVIFLSQPLYIDFSTYFKT